MAVTYDFQTPGVSTSAADTQEDIRNIAEMSWVWHVNASPHSLTNKPTGLIEAFYDSTVDFTSSIPAYGYQNYYSLKAFDGTNLGNLNFMQLFVHNDGAVLSNTVGTRGQEFISMGATAGYSCQSLAPWTINADVGNSGTTTYDPILAFQNQSVERARIYTDTSDSHKLKFDVGGSDWMTIDSSGKVGIGTSSPSYRLEVSDSNTTATQFSLDNTSTSGRNFRFLSTGSASGIGVGKFSIYDGDADGHRLVIDSSGNVGIGTSSPNHIVHIKETANSTTTANLILDSIVQYGYEAGTFEVRREDYYVSSFGGVWEDNDNSYARIGIRHSGSTVYPLTIRDNRIGIGTSSPSNPLEVREDGTTTPKILVRSISNGDPTMSFLSDSKQFTMGIDDTSNAFAISEGSGLGSADRLVINSSGNVGIGTSSPSSTFHVQKDQASATAVRIQNNTANSSAQAALYVNANGNNFSLINYPDADASNANITRFSSTASGSKFILAPDSTDTLTVDGSNVEVNTGNLVIGTSGKGIDFSATSGTGTSELLDDYEEGTFTPTLTTTGTGFSSVTYDASVSGSYTKVGRKVFFTLFIGTDAVTKGSASGGITVAGLPFTSNSTLGVGRSVVRLTASNFLADAPIVGTITENTSYIQLSKRATSVSGDTALQVADIGTGANANFMSISGSYQI